MGKKKQKTEIEKNTHTPEKYVKRKNQNMYKRLRFL